MHMSDTLISPVVAGSCWSLSAGLLAFASRRFRQDPRNDVRMPLMAALGAFVFAAQMIDVPILATGSSGHLGGGILLAIILGPHAAVLVMATALLVQAVLFGDGGLLALGCNVLNLGILPAYVVYPWVYRPLARQGGSAAQTAGAAVAASVVALQLGAGGVVLQVAASGVTEFSAASFAAPMLSIHLGIGLLEGVATVAGLALLQPRTRFDSRVPALPPPGWKTPPTIGLLATALVLGGALSWFASEHPDGLEWAVAKSSGDSEIAGASSRWHRHAEAFQDRTVLLPGYGFAESTSLSRALERTGTSLAGVTGSLVTLGLILLLAGGRRPRSLQVEVADHGKMIG